MVWWGHILAFLADIHAFRREDAVPRACRAVPNGFDAQSLLGAPQRAVRDTGILGAGRQLLGWNAPTGKFFAQEVLSLCQGTTSRAVTRCFGIG